MRASRTAAIVALCSAGLLTASCGGQVPPSTSGTSSQESVMPEVWPEMPEPGQPP